MGDDIYASLILALIGSVAVIGFTYWFFRWVSKKYSFAATRNIKIIDRVAVGKDKFIMIADICGGRYVIGVTPQQFTLLKDLGEAETQPQPEAAPQDFVSIFGTMLKKRLGNIKGKGVGHETQNH